MKMISALARVLILATSLAAPVAYADILLDTTGAVMLTDPTQLGRPSRNGVPQNWGGVESAPGFINTTTLYHYSVILVDVGLTGFVQIDFSSTLNVFVSAYLGSYNPLSPNTNWLGDLGSSGLAFGTDVPFFDVKAAPDSIIAIVVNNTGGNNLGVGDQYHMLVEGFLDAEFTSTPEPSTLLLCFLPLVALLGREAWKRRRDAGGGIAA